MRYIVKAVDLLHDDEIIVFEGKEVEKEKYMQNLTSCFAALLKFEGLVVSLFCGNRLCTFVGTMFGQRQIFRNLKWKHEVRSHC